MAEAEYAADQTIAALRISKLHAYFKYHVLNHNEFICSSHRECEGSHCGTFYAGQLPHVGTHYDLTRNGTPFRIVVVGQEYGHEPEHVDLTARRTMILHESGARSRFRAEPGFPARNPHMKGCTSVLRLLFGKEPGSDYESEFVELGGTLIHIFDCFALVNFLLCSAVSSEITPRKALGLRGKRGESTKIMRQNCARHFRATIEILEPTLIVIQGVGVLGWMKTVFDTLSTDAVQTIQIKGNSACVLAFTHPAAYGAQNWGVSGRTPYLLNVVAPTIKVVLGPQSEPTKL